MGYIDLILSLLVSPYEGGDFWILAWKFIPYVVFLELPYTVFVMVGVVRYKLERMASATRRPYFPPVSAIAICYGEGKSVQHTILSIADQIYPGNIQIVAMIDGAVKNKVTYESALEMLPIVKRYKNRELIVVPKWHRGGRVSNMNAGIFYSNGEIIMALDGDTSFDNNMVERATRHFEDPSVAAVSGCLRARNADKTIVTELQSIEYFISIQSSRAGLSPFNAINNVSGAFGVFRRSTLELMGGWDSGTAEDVDMTLRIKNYFGRYKDKIKIVFDHEAMGHTDVPETMMGLLNQRLRWDGDLPYVYIKKHWRSFNPRIIGWTNFFVIIISGLFYQVVLPFIIFIYTVWIFFSYPVYYALALMLLVYVFYFCLLSSMYIFFVMLLSERFLEDIKRVIYLPVYPLFNFVVRINSMVANTWELIRNAHKDTSMQPWWVSKKNKF